MNITLYVSDELGKRIEEHKDELKLSNLFQEAVEDELERLRASSRTGLERLRESKLESDKRWKALGERDGMAWAMDEGDYDDVAHVVQLDEYYNEKPVDFDIDDVIARLSELTGDSPDQLVSDGDDEIPNQEAYLTGFIAGAARVGRRLL